MPSVLCLGDSVTAGYPGPGGGWRAALKDVMAALGKPITYLGGETQFNPPGRDDLQHEGHDGYTIGQIWSLVNGGLLERCPADVVLMEIGINDVGDSVPPAVSAINYGSLLGLIVAKQPQCRLVVTAIGGSPGWEGQAGVKASIADMNAMQLRAVMSLRRFAVNYFAAALTDNGQFLDGVHPTPAGYQAKAMALASWLCRVL